MAPLDPMRSSNTYMHVDAIAREVNDISSSTSEGHVNGVWSSILDWVFPSTEGYITRAQAQHTEWGGRKGFSDFHTFEWDTTANKRVFFLITQCKPKAKEGQKAAWQHGADQLGDYLFMQHGRRPVISRSDAYGILAIGRKVRFFRYSDARGNVVEFRPGTTETQKREGKEFFDLVEDAGQVMAALRWIRRHHN